MTGKTARERYADAAHAMQSGVKADMETDTRSQGATTPKHLRVGVNSALVDSAALAWLLVSKGVITEDEYLDALASGMEREARRYEALLSERHGTKITLA